MEGGKKGHDCPHPLGVEQLQSPTCEAFQSFQNRNTSYNVCITNKFGLLTSLYLVLQTLHRLQLSILQLWSDGLCHQLYAKWELQCMAAARHLLSQKLENYAQVLTKFSSTNQKNITWSITEKQDTTSTYWTLWKTKWVPSNFVETYLPCPSHQEYTQLKMTSCEVNELQRIKETL